MKINIKNKFFRNTFELLGNILSFPLSLLFLLLYLLLGLFMPIIAFGLLAYTIKNWKISLPIIFVVCIGIICLNKLHNYYETKKRERKRELERQEACEFCKGHPNIKHPIRHEILPFKGFCKSLFGWNKFGRAYIKSKGGEQPSVVVYDIEKEVKYNSFGYAKKPIDSYEIPIFNMKSDFEDQALVNLEESDIIKIETMDRHTYTFISPKLIPHDEVNKISHELQKKAKTFCEGEKEGGNSQKDSHKAFSLFQEAARMGDAEAQCCMGCCYRNGYGTVVDYQKARLWYEKSANNGCIRAIRHIARTYEEGLGVSQSYEKAVEWYTKAAEQGDARAQFNLGLCYKKGQGVPQSYEKAVEWYTKAAEQGDATAQCNLGFCYEEGQGVSQSYQKAVEWYTKAAEQGDATAQFNLGLCYKKGQGMSQSYEKAVEWYTKAAEQGLALAQCFLGLCYEEGQGVSHSYQKAVEWYTKAAEQGFALAQCFLGLCYKKGQGVPQSYEKAVEWYTKAAEQGYAIAQFFLGNCYKNGKGVPKNLSKTVEWYTKAAEQGDTNAQERLKELGDHYYYGRSVLQSYEKAAECYSKIAEKVDSTILYDLGYRFSKGQDTFQNYEKAVFWYTKAAEQGHTEAQNNLGVCYECGRGVHQNYEKAVEWYIKAAENGNANAKRNLGICYEYGRGVPQSYEIAVCWYAFAAILGNADAQFNLGVCFEKGQGVLQNQEGAVYWYTKAAEQGLGIAQFYLGRLCFCAYLSYEKANEWYEKAANQGPASTQEMLETYYAKVFDNLNRLKHEDFQLDENHEKSYGVPQCVNNIFNQDQKEVINLNKGHHLVLAPPGCGKTRVLAERVVTAVSNQVDVADMLCLTFTNRAAREMRDRISSRAEQEMLDKLFVGNVHHFCSYMLREYKVISQRTTIIDDEESTAILQNIVHQVTGKEKKDVDSYYNYQHYLYQIEHQHPEKLIVRSEFGDKLVDFEYKKVAREYVSYKEKYGLLDFEDLLLKGYDYIRDHQNDIKKYSWIQIDEVQDLNSLQLAIIDLVVTDDPCIVYLGDEQQAIYGFNGVKMATLDSLKDRCAGNIHHFLGNYRSPQYLLDVLNQYAEVNLHVSRELLPIAKGKDAQNTKEDGSLIMETCDQKEGMDLSDYCSYDMACDRAISYQDGRTAILANSNREVDIISERLYRRGVEHFKISGSDFMWTKEVKLILSHFNIFIHPENIMSWARILMGFKVMPTLEEAHAFLLEANDSYLYANDLLSDKRRSLIKEFLRYYPDEFVIFDTETTGLDVNNDDIVEIAAIRIKEGCIIDELDIMLETTKNIPVELNGEPNPLIEEYPKREKVGRRVGLTDFLSWVGNVPVLAHNAKFDFQILDANLKRDCSINDLSSRWPIVLDSLNIARAVEPGQESYRLKDLLAAFNLAGKNSHLAIDDVKATKSLVDYCYKKASPIFVKQNEFYAENRDVIEMLRKQYSNLYCHTKALLFEKDSERNVFVDELAYVYDYLVNDEIIGKMEKMKYLTEFLERDFLQETSELTLRQIIDKYMLELNTLREADLCDSKSLREKVGLFVSTVHRAKGLEFDNVVVTGVVDGIYPFWETTKILKESYIPKEREKAQRDIEESARKLYVALSRSKKRLCIQYPRNNTGYGKFGWYQHIAKPSPFISCISPMFDNVMN